MSQRLGRSQAVQKRVELLLRVPQGQIQVSSPGLGIVLTRRGRSQTLQYRWDPLLRVPQVQIQLSSPLRGAGFDAGAVRRVCPQLEQVRAPSELRKPQLHRQPPVPEAPGARAAEVPVLGTSAGFCRFRAL